MDWSSFLKNIEERQNLDSPFPVDKFEEQEPALITTPSLLSGALTAARILQIIARRGGTRYSPDVFSKLTDLIASSLPEGVKNLAEDEAAQVLEWLERAKNPPQEQEARGIPATTDEEKIVFETDIESRVSVCKFALEEDYDLELEYYDADTGTWPLLRGTPAKIHDFPQSDEHRLDLEVGDQTYEIQIRHIRWLMPVSRKNTPEFASAEPEEGDVIPFPKEPETD